MFYEKVFRAYDIRGIYPIEINEDFAYYLGRALATHFKGKKRKVIVGNDTRLSGEKLKNSLIKSLTEAGFDVIDIGINPTPLVAFATVVLKAKFGVTITASHNPKEWNGFIINNSKGLGIGLGSGLEKISKIFKNKSFSISSPKKLGRVEKLDIYKTYINFLRNRMNFESELSIVVDAGNGAASEIIPKIIKTYNKGNLIELFCRFDGNFPNRDPEPKKEAIFKLIEKVLIEKADVGFAYDGDADRMVIVDDKGNVLLSHQILSLFMYAYEKRMKNKKIVIDILNSIAALEEIRKFGAIPIISRVGRTFIQREMFKNKAILGAEASYHFYFKEVFNLDDVCFGTIKILELLTKTNKKLSEIVSKIPVYYYESKRIETKEELKVKIIENLKNEFKDYKIESIDGIKIWIDNESWIVFRPSNTEPKISIAYEAKNEKRFEELKQIVNNIVEKIKSI